MGDGENVRGLARSEVDYIVVGKIEEYHVIALLVFYTQGINIQYSDSQTVRNITTTDGHSRRAYVVEYPRVADVSIK